MGFVGKHARVEDDRVLSGGTGKPESAAISFCRLGNEVSMFHDNGLGTHNADTDIRR